MTVFVFPGQGSQSRGMGQALFAKHRALVAEADRVLGYSVEELCLRDPRNVLAKTEYTQPALYTVCAMQYLDLVAQGGEVPSALAGHSLGEYSALFAAGAFDFATGLRLVQKRGELMSHAPRGAMAAVVNLSLPQVTEILARLPYRNIDLANINSPKQCVLSGLESELLQDDVRRFFLDAGGAFVPLNVSAAFHSRCMQIVEREFASFLATISLQPLRATVISNYTARPYPEIDYAELMVRQITSPVRWYESVSWLLHRGDGPFVEIGPGNVLTKLCDAAREQPLVIADVASAPRRAARRTKLVFMYGGQGSQYPHMGRALNESNPVFRTSLERCSTIYEQRCGASLVGWLYGDRTPELDDILFSHAALYSIGLSLTHVLREEGFHPDATLGHSLGEYLAATVAGMITVEGALGLVIQQAKLLHENCKGGMLSVLGSPALYDERDPLFAGTTLAGVNFQGNFLISGPDARLREVQAVLDRRGVIAVRLPVRQAFHSPGVEPIRSAFAAAAQPLAVRRATMPVYSSALAGPLPDDVVTSWVDHTWSVLRGPIQFERLMSRCFQPRSEWFFVDLSASGSFSNFLRHGYGSECQTAAAINQFGSNATTMERLRGELRALR